MIYKYFYNFFEGMELGTKVEETSGMNEVLWKCFCCTPSTEAGLRYDVSTIYNAVLSWTEVHTLSQLEVVSFTV